MLIIIIIIIIFVCSLTLYKDIHVFISIPAVFKALLLII
jgi:hypothetical protein